MENFWVRMRDKIFLYILQTNFKLYIANFRKDTLVADSRNEKRYIQFAVFGIFVPAIYTSLGFFMHHMTPGYVANLFAKLLIAMKKLVKL